MRRLIVEKMSFVEQPLAPRNGEEMVNEFHRWSGSIINAEIDSTTNADGCMMERSQYDEFYFS